MEEAMKKNKNLEPELRPSYIKKIKKIQQSGDFREFSSVEQLRGEIERNNKALTKKEKQEIARLVHSRKKTLKYCSKNH